MLTNTNKGAEGTEGIDGKRQGRQHDHSITGVKKILIADELLDQLANLQRGTRPRLDLRQFVEACIELVLTSPDALAALPNAAKQRLIRELSGTSTGN